MSQATTYYPADMLVYTTEDRSQPRALCWKHVNERRENGTIVVKDGVNLRLKGWGEWECGDCTA